MSSWETWEMSAEWCSESVCPDCGHSLIITEYIASSLYNAICTDCRKQYTISSTDTLTVNTIALKQQDRIDALEERIARLEAIVQELMRRPTAPTRPPITTQQNATEKEDIKARYKYLF